MRSEPAWSHGIFLAHVELVLEAREALLRGGFGRGQGDDDADDK